MAADNFDLQGWMREQKQGPFNKKALKESIGGYVDFNSYNSLSEQEEEEDMEDDWNKPEEDNTPDEDSIHKAALKHAKKASKSVKGLNPDKDIHDLLYGDDEDLYEGMSPEAYERMEGLANTKHLEAFKELFRRLVNAWQEEGFDQDDIINYVSGIGGFSTSHPFMNQDLYEGEMGNTKTIEMDMVFSFGDNNKLLDYLEKHNILMNIVTWHGPAAGNPLVEFTGNDGALRSMLDDLFGADEDDIDMYMGTEGDEEEM